MAPVTENGGSSIDRAQATSNENDLSKYVRLHAWLDSVSSMKLVYHDGHLRIEGFDKRGNLAATIEFDSIILVRIMDEGSKLRLIQSMPKDFGSIYRVTEDDEGVTDWMSREDFGTRDLRESNHFLILMAEEVVDVVSASEPHVELF